MVLEIKLTKAAVERVPPGEGWVKISHPSMPGLQLYSAGSGDKTFYLYRRVNGTPKRIRLGAHPDLTPELVRKMAAQRAAEIAGGGDPNARKKRETAEETTLRQAFEAMLESRKIGEKPLKPRTIEDYQGAMDVTFKEAGWLNKPLKSITRSMVQKLHAKRSKESRSRADHAMRVLRAVFNYAMETLEDAEGNAIITDNPVRRLHAVRAWNNVDRRKTIISEEDLPKWCGAVLALEGKNATSSGDVAKDLFLFTLLTGLRKLEAARVEWRCVDLRARVFTVLDTKNREPHTLPLSDYLADMLERRSRERSHGDRYVFQTERLPHYMTDWRWWVKKVTQDSGVDWTPRDLRRVFITTAEKLDLPMSAVKRLVNHKTGNDVTEGYVITDVERLRRPAQAITDYLLSVGEVRGKAAIVHLQSFGAT